MARLPDRYAAVTPPLGNPAYDGYWEGCREHDIRVPHCADCGRAHWYPLGRCPYCQGGTLRYESVGLDATLFSWGIPRRALHPGLTDRLGEIVALVLPRNAPDLRLVTNVVGVEASELAPGLSLRADFVDVSDEITLPVYRPTSS